MHAAKYLNEAHAFDLLLELQVFMLDWPRAGLTCVKLFHIESSFAARLEYLRLARNYFSNALKEQQQERVRRAHSGREADGPAHDAPPLSEAELSRYFRKVMLQIAILELLEAQVRCARAFSLMWAHSGAQPNVAHDEELRRLSMFGSAKERIAERLVVLAPESDLGFRLMQEFRLPQGEVYARAVRELVSARRRTEVAGLLKQIKALLEGEEWDTVVLALVRALAEDAGDKAAAEKYIGKLSSPRAQVQAYRVCGLLKTAYVLAAKSGFVDEVQAVRVAALQAGSSTVVQLCNAYLAKAGTPQ